MSEIWCWFEWNPILDKRPKFCGYAVESSTHCTWVSLPRSSSTIWKAAAPWHLFWKKLEQQLSLARGYNTTGLLLSRVSLHVSPARTFASSLFFFFPGNYLLWMHKDSAFQKFRLSRCRVAATKSLATENAQHSVIMSFKRLSLK